MESRFKVPNDKRQISEGILKNIGNSVEQQKLDKNIKANEIKLYIERKRKERNEKKKLNILNKLRLAKEKEIKLAELQKECKRIVNASITKREKITNTVTPEKISEDKTEIPQTNSDEKNENLELWDMEKRITTLQKQLEARRIELLGILEEHKKSKLKSFKEKEQELLKHLELYDKLIDKSKKSLVLEIKGKELQIEYCSHSNIQYTTEYNCKNILEKLSENLSLSPSDKTIWAEEKKYFCPIKTEELNTIESKALNDTDDIQTEMKNIHLKYQLSNDYSQNLNEETDFNDEAVDSNAITMDELSVQILEIPQDYINHGEQELCLKNESNNEKLSNTSSSSSNMQRELIVDSNENNDKVCEENWNDVNPLEVSNNEIKIQCYCSFVTISDENVSQCEKSSVIYKLHDLIKCQIERQNNEHEMSEDIKLKNKLTIERYSDDGNIVYSETKSSGEVILLKNSIDNCCLED